MRASMKKMIAMGLCVVMAVGTLTGCGGDDNSNSTASGTSTTKEGTSKKVFDDLGGMEILIGDWYTSADKEAKSDYAKATQKYREDIQKQYNFKIKRDNVYSYTDMQSTYVNGVMASDPMCDLFYLYQEFVSEPLMNGLMKDLSKLPELDFTEEKWNPTVTNLMTIGDGIWGMSTEDEPGAVFSSISVSLKKQVLMKMSHMTCRLPMSGHGRNLKSTVRG